MQFGFLKSILKLTQSLKGLVTAVVVSIFQSTVAVNVKCLRIRFIVSLIILFGLAVQADPQSEVIHREALFQRAYKSMAFIINISTEDKSFIEKLTKDEKTMLDHIYSLSAEIAFRQWVAKNNITRLGKAGHYSYVYMMPRNKQLVAMDTSLDKIFNLQFSNDQEFFRLDPSQPVRSARVLDSALDTNIYFNLAKINDPAENIDLARAMSILIHELGRKLGPYQNEVAVNSFAAKFEAYVRSLTNTTEITGKKVSVLRFMNFKAYDQWVENTFIGEYIGVNIPAKIHPLTVYDSQGIYVLVDDGSKVTDLTDSIISDIAKNKIVRYEEHKDFTMAKHNVILSSDIKVDTTTAGDLKFTVNANLLQAVLPFFKQDIQRIDYKLVYKDQFGVDTQDGTFLNKEFTINAKDYSVRQVKSLPLEFVKPNYQAEFLGKKQRGQDLELFFKISGDHNLSLGYKIRNESLWPEIILQISNSTRLRIKAHRYYEESGEYGFLIKDVQAISNKDVRVHSLQFTALKQNISLPHTDAITKGLLLKDVVLFKAIDASPSKVSTGAYLKSAQVWNGREWKSLRNRADIREGSLLRFVFKSDETIRTLVLSQNYQTNTERYVNLFGQKSPSYNFKENQQRQIEVGESNMKQVLKDGFLLVTVDIDHNLLTKFSNSNPTGIPAEDAKYMPKGEVANGDDKVSFLKGITENEILTVDSLREISGISFVTQSGMSKDFSLKTGLKFNKTDVKIRCEGLFL